MQINANEYLFSRSPAPMFTLVPYVNENRIDPETWHVAGSAAGETFCAVSMTLQQTKLPAVLQLKPPRWDN